MQFRVEFYRARDGHEPTREFIDGLRATHPALHALLVSGLGKLGDSAHHGKRLTEIVDRRARIWEVRVGRAEIARIFWCFGPDRQRITVLWGYVKHGQSLDRGELERARRYKQDMEARAR